MTATNLDSSNTIAQPPIKCPIKSTIASPQATLTANNASTSNNYVPIYPGSSSVFQQVKQTQASLARLTRAQQQHHSTSQTNQSSQLSANNKQPNSNVIDSSQQQQQQPQQIITKSNTFVDCLIRRFKDCFSEDFCTVPMFVVGNLSPGSDGTHLILPPCVSLGRQNINRFASPKNLRLMNSIRESCRSIEELDLGGNKLNDLIEVYKILQCTPNLKFLNLSENDLSRSSPVAMAATCSSSSPVTSCSGNQASLNLASSTSMSIQSNSNSTSTTHNSYHTNQQNWSSSSMALNQRTCLAPINQNYQQHLPIGARSHSTLGQSTMPSRPITCNTSSNPSRRIQTPANRRCGTISRVAEARRSAAAAAVAQCKKTSSSIANKLTNSAAAAKDGSLVRKSELNRTQTSSLSNSNRAIDKLTNQALSGQRHQTNSASTMNLARSLSSLSAKDVRACSSTSINRMSGMANRTMKSNLTRSSSNGQASSSQSSTKASNSRVDITSAKQLPAAGKNSKLVSQKLFVEPIVEADNDVDMNEQQISPVRTSANDKQQQQLHHTRTPVNQTGIASHGTSMAKLNQSSLSNNSSANFRRTFETIKALALNNTGCQWRVVCSILSRMPNLEELHLSLNNYEKIDLEPNEFKHYSLKRLYLCNNPKLTNWQELDKLLIAFPSLEALSIADCNISQIPDNLDRAREWRKLCGLNINGWPIKEWPIIERLNQLPSLIDLKCRNLELLSTIDEPRHHLIARLPKLQKLNGSEIEEREHAEKAFLRFFMANSHLERPSRFHELIQIHGEVTSVDVDVDLSPPSHAQVRVVYLNRNHYKKENEDDIIMSEDFLIKLMDNVDPTSNTNVVQQQNSLDNIDVNNDLEGDSKLVRLFKDEGQEVLALEVDSRQSVRRFKSRLAQLFGLNNQSLILYYIDHEMVGLMGPELIKHNQKKLWNYNVQNGDQFIVEER